MMPDRIELVDESGRPIGQADVRQAHQARLLHHSVHIVLVNSKGRFFCAHRSLQKEIYGGWWTVPGAHVLVGESYEATARRLLQATFGIDCPLNAVGKIRVQDGHENEISQMFTGRSDQEFTVNPEGFDDGRFLTAEEARRLAHDQKATPYLVRAIEIVEQALGS